MADIYPHPAVTSIATEPLIHPAINSRRSQTVDGNERAGDVGDARARAVTKFKIFTYFQAAAHPSAPVITRCNQRAPAFLPAIPGRRLPPPRATARNRINCSYLINGRYDGMG